MALGERDKVEGNCLLDLHRCVEEHSLGDDGAVWLEALDPHWCLHERMEIDHFVKENRFIFWESLGHFKRPSGVFSHLSVTLAEIASAVLAWKGSFESRTKVGTFLRMYVRA